MAIHNERLDALFRQLDAGMSCRLTLIAAPAGAGKSALLRRWLHARERPAAWVELDAADNVPAHFVRHLVAASRHLLAPSSQASDLLAPTMLAPDHNPAPGTGRDTEALLATQDALAAWLNALASLEQEFCLVLDGYERVTAPPVHDAVRLMLDYPPPHMHLFITTRTEPPLQLPRLRVRRQLMEVRLA
jgi:LuxR family maltose regulon positive regulatory protein